MNKGQDHRMPVALRNAKRAAYKGRALMMLRKRDMLCGFPI
jgi:hypothetical protein